MFNLFKVKGRLNFIIKNHSIRYVHSKSSNINQIEQTGEIILPYHVMEDGRINDYREFTSIIEDFIENKGWKNKSLYFTVPDHSVVIRPYKVPATLKADEIKGYLYMQLGETLHLPFEDPAFDYSILENGEKETELLLFAYPEEQIRKLEQVFKDAKLKPKAADISALSVYRFYEHLGMAAKEEPLLLIDWNMDGCVLTVFKEHLPAFINHTKCPLALNLWKRENGRYIWQGDEGDPSDFTYDQVNEIERIMDFYRFSLMNGEAGVSKVLLTGDWPENERALSLLEEKAIHVETLMEPSLFIETEHPVSVECVDAIGLSIKQ
ncbi:type IV pilus biogenesis protein PilM [Halobacillus sp. H74]|uniref:type IV pilus biogenesis protein PilM n=1 Tax=Halobacillus sp. H74 TaxID=3457436 RepID=UPI003FCEDB8B